MYDGGYMDGACNHGAGKACGQVLYPCPFDTTKNCSQYTYVENTAQDPVVQPYWDIAEKYSFANYMFQTNQGPSLPAHQFLFGGTSVPVYPTDNHQHNNFFFYQYFVENNPLDPNKSDGNPGEKTGCISPYSTQYISWIDPSQTTWMTPTFPFSYPCYDHATLTDLLDQNQLSWQWYPRALNTLWESPTDIFHICQPSGNNGPPYAYCGGTEWQNNFELNLPGKPPLNDNEAKALEDIENCNLPAVSWVIPDGSGRTTEDTPAISKDPFGRRPLLTVWAMPPTVTEMATGTTRSSSSHGTIGAATTTTSCHGGATVQGHAWGTPILYGTTTDRSMSMGSVCPCSWFRRTQNRGTFLDLAGRLGNIVVQTSSTSTFTISEAF
jgi:hypothetical protein